MNKSLQSSSLHLLLFAFVLLASCNTENKTNLSESRAVESVAIPQDTLVKESQLSAQNYRDPFKGLNIDAQIMQVLRRVFQDKPGNLWFVGDDVFCFDGDSLIDFSNYEPFKKTVARQIAEDQAGNVWFGTSQGIVKYNPGAELSINPESFTQFTEEDGLINNDVWSMAIDKQGIIWVGTLEGVSRFDGETFTAFDLPESEPDNTRGVTSTRVVHHIMEDSKGNMWFGTNGGAYIYDGTSLSHISEKEGLCNKVLNDILEDKNGNIWFATHHKGVCRWDGNSFTHFTTEDGINGTESWSLYEDRSGNIWFPIENAGIYRYNLSASHKAGTASFTNFHKEEGLPLNAVHSVVEDTDGLLWFGGFGGLYRYDGKSFINVTPDGPWPE